MIKQDHRNYRIHGDKNKSLIKKSVDELGAGRSILIDADNEIIAGNGVFEQWGDRPVRIVETDGSELIVVQRKDLKRNDKKRQQLAILDNSASDSSEFDYRILREDLEDLEIEDVEMFGLDINKLNLDYANASTGINDINEVQSFNESVNFTIKCESIEQLEELQTKLNTGAQKISYNDFLIKAGL